MDLNLGGQKNNNQNNNLNGGGLSLSNLSLNRNESPSYDHAPQQINQSPQQHFQPQNPVPMSGGVTLAKKGQKISLNKLCANLDYLHIGLGWDTNQYVGDSFDLDAQVFMVDENDRVIDPSYFIFYNQTQSPDGSVRHSGDNRNGLGEGEDESVEIVLSKIDTRVKKLIFSVTIHEGLRKNQSFGQVRNAFISVYDQSTGNRVPLIRYDLTENYSVETSLIVGEIYRYNNEWRFAAIGAGYETDLAGFCGRYGVPLE